MNGPDRSERAVAALEAVARGTVERRPDSKVSNEHGMVWLINGVRPARVVSALLTRFGQTLAGGPYVSTPEGGGKARLTPAGERLWAQWQR